MVTAMAKVIVTLAMRIKKLNEKMDTINNEKWDQIIGGKNKVSLGLKDTFKYRDLLFLFVKRDLSTIYKQTILGPFWLVLQPLLTSLVFMVIFGNLMGITTDGYPKFLFYFSGLLFWSLFAEIFQKSADTFITNSDLFSKVFFPRLVMPFSIVFTSLIKFSFSFIIFSIIWLVYFINGEIKIESFLPMILFLPIILFFTMLLGMALGLIFSTLTTKYRDFRFLLQFGIQLLMYFSPVIFPLNLAEGKLRTIIELNPMSGLIECSRSIFLNGSFPNINVLLISICSAIAFWFAGLLLFSRVQKSFIDTI